MKTTILALAAMCSIASAPASSYPAERYSHGNARLEDFQASAQRFDRSPRDDRRLSLGAGDELGQTATGGPVGGRSDRN